MQPNKTLLLVSMKTQSKVSICMAHGHIYLSEARQLHHGRFRHIKPNTNCQSKGRGRQGRVSGWGRKRLAKTLGCLQTSQRKYLPPRCLKFSLSFFFSVFSFCFSINKLSLLQVLISFYTKTCTSRSDVLLNTHQNLWPKPLTYRIYNRLRRLIHSSHSCSY